MLEIKSYKKGYQIEIDIMINDISKEFLLPISNGKVSTTLSFDEYWVAFIKGKIVGTVAVLNIENSFSILKNMFVKKEYRGKSYGVSQQLLNKALERSQKQGVKTIYLGTMNQFKAAHKFYEKNDFQKISSSKLPSLFSLNPVDDVFYKKNLDSQ